MLPLFFNSLLFFFTSGPCLALTFEPCHSLLESSTFYLPNCLHHQRALEVTDAYRELSGSPVNTSCSKFSIYYLCALLFPPCDNSNFPIYPCDTLCQGGSLIWNMLFHCWFHLFDLLLHIGLRHIDCTVILFRYR